MLCRMAMLRRMTASSLVGRIQFSRLSSAAQCTEAPAAVSNFIDGVPTTTSLSKQTLENVNPANGQVISTMPRSNAADVEAAVAAAQRAAPIARAMPLAARAALLERVASIIEVQPRRQKKDYLDTRVQCDVVPTFYVWPENLFQSRCVWSSNLLDNFCSPVCLDLCASVDSQDSRRSL